MTSVQRSRLVLTLIACSCLSGAAAENPATPSIPDCVGLTIVTAVAQQYGDYESIKTIEAAGPKEVIGNRELLPADVSGKVGGNHSGNNVHWNVGGGLEGT